MPSIGWTAPIARSTPHAVSSTRGARRPRRGNMSRLFTSESVTEGHPDKLADAVSDAVLDALLAQDLNSRVAVETLVTTGTVIVAGEVTTNAYADISGIARERILGWMDPFPAARAGFIGAVVGSVVGALANDSGSLLLLVGAAFCAAYAGLAWSAQYFTSDSESG